MARRRTHGSGTIFQRANGRYTAVVADDDGRRRSLGTFDTRKDADRALSRAVTVGF